MNAKLFMKVHWIKWRSFQGANVKILPKKLQSLVLIFEKITFPYNQFHTSTKPHTPTTPYSHATMPLNICSLRSKTQMPEPRSFFSEMSRDKQNKGHTVKPMNTHLFATEHHACTRGFSGCPERTVTSYFRVYTCFQLHLYLHLLLETGIHWKSAFPYLFKQAFTGDDT